ncbi:kinesin-like protein klp98a [Anaeramoeba flamelloides]|uniref:Kinesin-like protein klp98a n=1 Tax=Anaeramoeba flamelloides TaxID=1746091 RepID=A0ABQ8X8M4_9EUKA|nr:kinesin-like protein klp98a [Anaeramoeba flamelloides]
MHKSDSETTSDSYYSDKVVSTQKNGESSEGSSSGEYSSGETSTSNSSGSNSQVSSYEDNSESESEYEYESESESESEYESGEDGFEQDVDEKKQKEEHEKNQEEKDQTEKPDNEFSNEEHENDENKKEEQKKSSIFEKEEDGDINELKDKNKVEKENDQKENKKEEQKQSSELGDEEDENENNEKKKENQEKELEINPEKDEEETEKEEEKKKVEKEIEQKKKEEYEKYLTKSQRKYSYRIWEHKMKNNDLNRIKQITKEMDRWLKSHTKFEKEIQILNQNNRKLKEENRILDGVIHSLKNLKKKTKKEFSAQVAKNELYNKKQLQRSKHNNLQLRILNDKAKNSEFAKYYLPPNKVLKNFKYQIKDNFSYFVDENTQENNLLNNIYTISRLCFFQIKEFLLQYENQLFKILKIKQVQTSQFINVFLDKIKNKCHQLILDPKTKNNFFTQTRKSFTSITMLKSDLYEKIKEFFYTICQCYLDLLICDPHLRLLEKMGENKDPKFTYPLNDKLDGEWIYCFPGLQGKHISLTNYVFVL